MKKTIRTLPMAAVAMALVWSLAGCTGTTDSDGDGTVASPTPTATTPVLPAVPEITDAEGAVRDSTTPECIVAEGDATVEGTVTNSGDGPADYLLLYSWTGEGNAVLARGSAVVRDLAAGDSADWKVTATLPRGVQDCALLVERGTVAD